MKTTIKALLVILTFAFFSCQKNDQPTSATTDLTAAQLKSATITVNDVAVQNVSEEANYESYFYSEYEHMLRQLARVRGRHGNLMDEHSMMHYIAGEGPVLTIDTAATGYPITINIDYGTNTQTQNGRKISGKVTIVISGPKATDGTTRTTTFSNCKIDSIGIDGTSTETFNGDNTTTRKTTMATDLNFTLANGTVVNRTGTEVREWLAGLSTPLERSDDKIQVTGTITVKYSTGDTYTRVITDPLIILGDCANPVQGIIDYSKNNTVIAELNYGDGTCDNKATLTTNGSTVDITLKDHGMPKAKTEGQHMNNGEGMGNGSGKGMGNGTGNGTGTSNGMGNGMGH